MSKNRKPAKRPLGRKNEKVPRALRKGSATHPLDDAELASLLEVPRGELRELAALVSLLMGLEKRENDLLRHLKQSQMISGLGSINVREQPLEIESKIGK
jgi:hypothetical protein